MWNAICSSPKRSGSNKFRTNMLWKIFLTRTRLLSFHSKRITTTIGKMFCRHFHVTLSVFLEICESIKATHNLPNEKYDAKGQEGVKLSVLVLGLLRNLGSGCTFDAIED